MAEQQGIKISLTGPWKQYADVLQHASSPQKWRREMDLAVGKEAQLLRREIVQEFNAQGRKYAGGWKPLSDMTIAMRYAMGRRRTKALMFMGDLRGSIKALKVDSGVWFTGVHRKERSKRTGGELVNIAAVHEFGTRKPIRIRVTRRMRAFFLAMHLRTRGAWRPGSSRKAPKYMILPLAPGKTVLVMRIPARPFIRPAWNAMRGKSAERITEHVIKRMLLDLWRRAVRSGDLSQDVLPPGIRR